MACPAITTGGSFLATTLGHIDCQAKTLGSFGFAALANTGSPVSIALTSLLTIFIALFGLRLLLGYPMAGRDVIGDILKVGIVLTLATSWPAWRVLGYDLVIDGPSQIANAIGIGASMPGSSGDLAARLQHVDNGLAALNIYGSGRLGVAQGDWFQLGFARIAFLAGTLGPLVLVRLAAGILLAIAPLMAGLLLFRITRAIFVGWARGLVMTYLASLVLVLLLGAELAVLEPWLADALAKRSADQQTLDAPVELLAITLAFALACLGTLALVARIAFHTSEVVEAVFSGQKLHPREELPMTARTSTNTDISGETPSRATAVALSVSETLRREQRMMDTLQSAGGNRGDAGGSVGDRTTGRIYMGDTLGSSYRRNRRRVSAAGSRRDQAR